MDETAAAEVITMTDPDDDQAGEPSPDEILAEVIDLETQKRLWVRAIIPLLQARSRDSDPSPRVQLALDMMMVAACERVGRILRGDVADTPDT